MEFIKVADALRPKIVIAENVKGLILGNAKGYVYEILQAFDMAGYSVQIFLLNSAFMQVPQARERVFFIAHRKDLKLPKLQLNFDFPPIPFACLSADRGKYVASMASRLPACRAGRLNKTPKQSNIWKNVNQPTGVLQIFTSEIQPKKVMERQANALLVIGKFALQ